jgi:chromate transporter
MVNILDFFVTHMAQYGMLFMHFAHLSLLSVGGVIMLLPAMHQFLVTDKGWLNDAQFNSSIAIGQVSPGPSILFIGLMGWTIGINWLAVSYPTAPYIVSIVIGTISALISLMGIILPSSVVVYYASQVAQRYQNHRILRAFKQGLSPIVLALLIATGWIMSSTTPLTGSDWRHRVALWAVTAVTALIAWRSKLHLLWLLGAGAVLGAIGLV